MSNHEDLQLQLRQADPYPDSVDLPMSLVADRPDIDEIVESVPSLAVSRPVSSQPLGWRGPMIALAVAVTVLLVGTILTLTGQPDEVAPADDPAPVDEQLPVAPAGSGPALSWERLELPVRDIEWILTDGERFYLSPASYLDASDWLVSEDGRSWQEIPLSGAPPTFDDSYRFGSYRLDVPTRVAHNGMITGVVFPNVITVDSQTGEVVGSELDLTPLLDIENPCFDPQGEPEEVACQSARAAVTAGDQGILVWTEVVNAVDNACPPSPTTNQPAGDELEQFVVGGEIVAEGCAPLGWEVHPRAWVSRSGSTWRAVPPQGPFQPASIEDFDIVATDAGFVLTRVARNIYEVWFSSDGISWEQFDTPSEEQPYEVTAWGSQPEVTAWGSQAIGSFGGAWMGRASVGLSPFWLISDSDISVLNSEPLPGRVGDGYIAAGKVGIIALLEPVSGESFGWFEYSKDGISWSRRELPEAWPLPPGALLAADNEVLVYIPYGVAFIGTPDD